MLGYCIKLAIFKLAKSGTTLVKSCSMDSYNSGIASSKSILLIGVVLIHCNILAFCEPPAGLPAVSVIENVMIWCSYCVPLFFMISGYLYFWSFTGFDLQLFKLKTKKRIFSLVVPYVAWTTIYAVVRVFKALYLGYDGEGLVVDGNISFIGFVKGYWDTGDGYPVGFQLWFVRNLIVFVLAAPVVYLFAFRYWALCFMLLVSVVVGINLHGLEYFTIGAALALHRINIDRFSGSYCVPVLVLLAFVSLWHTADSSVFRMALTVAILFALTGVVSWSAGRSLLCRLSAGFLFFVYAVHGLYCSLIDRWLLHVVGYDTSFRLFACFVLALIIIMSVSMFFYWLFCRYCPGLIGMLCGRR